MADGSPASRIILLRSALGKAGGVTLREPAELRTELAQEIAAMAARYCPPSSRAAVDKHLP